MKIDRIEVVVDESVDGWMGTGERLKFGREVKESEGKVAKYEGRAGR